MNRFDLSMNVKCWWLTYPICHFLWFTLRYTSTNCLSWWKSWKASSFSRAAKDTILGSTLGRMPCITGRIIRWIRRIGQLWRNRIFTKYSWIQVSAEFRCWITDWLSRAPNKNNDTDSPSFNNGKIASRILSKPWPLLYYCCPLVPNYFNPRTKYWMLSNQMSLNARTVLWQCSINNYTMSFWILFINVL